MNFRKNPESIGEVRKRKSIAFEDQASLPLGRT